MTPEELEARRQKRVKAMRDVVVDMANDTSVHDILVALSDYCSSRADSIRPEPHETDHWYDAKIAEYWERDAEELDILAGKVWDCPENR